MHAQSPNRIVCLTEETTETLYLLGEQDRIVGISGYTVRPARARREKPKVSAFTSAKIDRILALKPDLVVGFSDLQADIAAELIRRGVNVLITNQRSVQEILDTILMIANVVGAEDKGRALVAGFAAHIQQVQASSAELSRRPSVYFEEWDEPMFSCIQWVSELITLAGGDDCFPDLSVMSHGKDRIIADGQTVIDANPDIIIGSWCGKKFQPGKVAARPGWEQITAVQNQAIVEIKSADILQPGPAALTDGLDQLAKIIRDHT